mgnify:CR=1 FL=1
MITFNDVKNNGEIQTYIQKADECLSALGFTEHSFAHVTKVAETAAMLLKTMGYSEREVELVKVAGYLHDIGNIINRMDHAQSGAAMAFRILDHMGADPVDIADVICAIGNHDEGTAVPINPISAALILADKSDVRYTRVRNTDFATFDIHDRVNYSVKKSELVINEDKTEVHLKLYIDTEFCSVMDYFEIFMGRMILCKKAAERLNLRFRLYVNGQKLL